MLILYSIAIFVGAFLLFLVQPMAAKGILPVLGGSPSVWNACMLFFQVALLAGYGYAHALARLRSVRVAVGVHAVVVLLPLVFLARAIPAEPGVPPTGNPIPWLLTLLATTVGPFFLVVATTGPLIQRWFATTDHPRAKDPYFLYAASNAGSLLALLAYPAVVEPTLALDGQARLFTAGYVVYVVLVLACGATLIRRAAATAPEAAPRGEAIPRFQRLLWVALAFLPSSLMLGATQFLSTDLAAVPLLWIVPLALYLLSFILAFAARQVLSLRVCALLLPVAVLALLGTMAAEAKGPLLLLVALHLGAMFLAAFVCHRRLALARPGPAGLTQYYLLIALGGALGGVLNTLVAPVVFNAITEYPIALVLACLMAPAWRRAGAPSSAPSGQRSAKIIDLGLVILPAGLAGIGLQAFDLVDSPRWLVVTWVAVPLVACAALLSRPRRFAAALAILLVVASLRPYPWGTLLFADRTFFGVVRVFLSRTDRWYVLLHGTTRHGVQANHPDLRREPTLYYHRGSPIGDFFRASEPDPTFDRCAVVGLGVGTLAAYGREGMDFTFYEIDPVVAAVASAPDLFHYLADSRANVGIVLGDARLKMRDAPDGEYDLIVLDAFSSDAIPVHLLTTEAIAMYRSKLAPDGVMAFHVSNRYLDLRPVIAAAARDLGLTAVVRWDIPTEQQQGLGATSSVWMLLGRDDGALQRLKDMEGWYRYEAGPDSRAWTDDYSNLLGAFSTGQN